MSIKFGDIFNTSDFNINNPKFEEFLNKTKDVAETVGKKSAERLDISRKKLELLDIKAKLSKTYEKFGRLQYKSFIGEEVDAEKLEEMVTEISQLNDKVDILSFDIECATASFNESVANMAQKTRDSFNKGGSADADVDMDLASEMLESEDEEE